MLKRKPKRYASALHSVAKEHGIVEEVHESLQFLSALYGEDRYFRFFFYSAKVEPDQKIEVLSSLFGGRVERTVLEFLGILAERKEYSVLRATAKAFDLLYRRQLDLVSVTATTSFPLNDEEYEQIRRRLEASLGKRVQMDSEVDSRLVGGIKLRIGDTLLDSSIATRLEKMKQSLL